MYKEYLFRFIYSGGITRDLYNRRDGNISQRQQNRNRCMYLLTTEWITKYDVLLLNKDLNSDFKYLMSCLDKTYTIYEHSEFQYKHFIHCYNSTAEYTCEPRLIKIFYLDYFYHLLEQYDTNIQCVALAIPCIPLPFSPVIATRVVHLTFDFRAFIEFTFSL